MKLAVTLGDPRGIGPEVVNATVRTLASRPDRPWLTLVGPEDRTAAAVGDHRFTSIGNWTGDGDAAEAGRLAGRAIDAAIDLARSGEVDGIVTAPIDKAAFNAAGYRFPGHTEMLAERTATTDVAMLMAADSTALGGPLRVVLVTVHLALADVPAALTVDRIVRQGRLADSGLRAGWGLARPRLALCALNPHASDGGLFGDEEERILAPARDALRAEGISVAGPIPADTVFSRAIRDDFDVVLAPYHDVGMAAFKTASFGRGVNVTLGLPFVRTSPDHGTAMDIAGTGRADPSSMIEAVDLANRLATRGNG